MFQFLIFSICLHCYFNEIFFRAGPKPKMPKKELNRTYESEESLLKKLSEENNVGLPGSLKNKYTLGRIIGDGKS